MVLQTLNLDIENVGGIEHDSVDIKPGVTVLSGENATNRTSLMKSLMAALGSDDAPIRSGTEQGSVNLAIGDDEYQRTVTNTQSGWKWDGEGVVEDVELLELFSFLLEQNEVRETIATGGDLYELVMNPIDTDEIERKIDELKDEREEITRQEGSIDDKKDKITRLENEIDEKEEEKEKLHTELEEVTDEIAAIDADDIETDKIDTSKELNAKSKELESKKLELGNDLERLRQQKSTREEKLTRLQNSDFDDVEELESRVSEIDSEVNELNNEISDFKKDKRKLEPLQRFLSQITGDAATPAEMNRVVNNYTGEHIINDDGGDVTDEFLSDDTDNCVLCGGEVDSDHYETLLKTVNKTISEISASIENVDSDINKLRSERDNLRNQIRNIRGSKDEIESLKSEIHNIVGKIDDKRSEYESVQSDIEDVQEQIKQIEEDAVQEAEDKTSKLQDLESKRTEIEIDIESIESDIKSKEETIESLEAKIESIEDKVDNRKPEINSELEELKGKVKSIENDIVTQFNDRMDEIINRLDYSNIERIWIEQKEQEVKKGRRKVVETVFDLHVVREVDGAVTEDTVTNLSESEREVTSIIFALTGYLVHDVGDIFPIIMMDSVEMIDANRLERLLEYMEEYVDYLIVATLPEDTQEMDVGSVIEKGAATA